VITVPFTIPGEHVRARVRRLRDGTCIGVVDEILRPSAHRVAPHCPHFGYETGFDFRRGSNAEIKRGFLRGCGGCSWQHIAYPEQLRLKSELVTRLLREAVPRAPAARPALTATPADSPWGYRQKVHFVFGAGPGGSLAMGHYARGTRRVIPVAACPVHDQRGNALAYRFRDAFRTSGAHSCDESALRGLAVRVGANTPEVMATLVLSGDADRRLRHATRQVIEADASTSVHVNLHPRGDAYVFGRETRRIAGSERLREEVAGVSFLISPTAFFQTNVRAADILVRLVVDAIKPPARVLDLYAGAGLFALPLARAGSQVVAVEESREAIADGEASRRLNGIVEQQCQFIPRRVEDALRALRQQFDAVILDPPRSGCSADVITRVFGRLRPALAVYVSCNPEALARDSKAIVRCGYEIVSLQPVDMFPHTAHVETVAILRRRPDGRMTNRRGDRR
jgi:23S rRNA (uracil1939-C5)-methyltransferase